MQEQITDRQKNFIRALLKELDESAFRDDTLQQLDNRQASSIIRQLQVVQAELRGKQERDIERLPNLHAESAEDVRSAWLLGSALWRW